MGASQTTVSRRSDRAIEGDVLGLRYTLPRGTAAGVWAKGPWSAESVDLVRLGARAEDPDQARQIALSLEMKGTSGIQRIPIPVRPDWSLSEESVDWPTIGTLMEVVAVSRIGDRETAAGTVDLDVSFDRLPWLRKLSMHPGARIVGVLLVSLLASVALGLLRMVPRRWTGRYRDDGETRERPVRAPSREATRWLDLRRDFVQGVGNVLIGLLTVGIFHLGELGRFEVGWIALGVAFAGAAIAEWWKFGLTGTHLTPAELFQDMLATGLLAASTSPIAILQAPGSWPDMFRLSQTVAAVAALLYHGANAFRLASSGRHLGDVSGALIVGTPNVTGALLLLESHALLQALGGVLTAGTWPTGRSRAGSSVACSSSSPSTRRSPTGSAWRRDAPCSGPSRPTWRCSPSRPPRLRPPGSRPWARARRSPPGRPVIG